MAYPTAEHASHQYLGDPMLCGPEFRDNYSLQSSGMSCVNVISHATLIPFRAVFLQQAVVSPSVSSQTCMSQRLNTGLYALLYCPQLLEQALVVLSVARLNAVSFICSLVYGSKTDAEYT